MVSFIDEYHKLYDSSRVWEKNLWCNIPCWKFPPDMMILQEIIVRTRPDYIIETGTAYGGSTAFYASICELIDHGQVVTVDIKLRAKMGEIKKYKFADRIKLVFGGSTNLLVVDKVEKEVNNSRNCMVILDSWHTEEYVYKEMNLYSKFVPVGGYLVVEDTHASNTGNPIKWKYDDKGPSVAVERFLNENDNWEIDYECEKHLMSFQPGGYLRKIE